MGEINQICSTENGLEGTEWALVPVGRLWYSFRKEMMETWIGMSVVKIGDRNSQDLVLRSLWRRRENHDEEEGIEIDRLSGHQRSTGKSICARNGLCLFCSLLYP
jgi:hypothetical protein